MINKDTILKERADFLRRKDRTITILAALLGVSVLAIIGALLVDMLNPEVGFFWLDRLAALR